MVKNIIKEEIVEMLEVIVEQSEVINNYENLIPQIEIDIVLSNIRDLYSKFKSLEKENKFQIVQPTPSVEEQIIHETINETVLIKEPEIVEQKIRVEQIAEINTPVIEEKSKVAEVAPVIVDKPKEVIPPVEITPPVITPVEEKKEIVQEPINIPEQLNEETDEQQDKKTKSKKFSLDLFSPHNTIADKFKDDKKSLNEKHSVTQTDKSIGSKLQKNPVKDLKAAIGINEKFKFINELFDGSLQKYNECIALLNGFAGSEAAFKYMSFLKEEFKWKENSEAYQELSDLVSRRYIS